MTRHAPHAPGAALARPPLGRQPEVQVGPGVTVPVGDRGAQPRPLFVRHHGEALPPCRALCAGRQRPGLPGAWRQGHMRPRARLHPGAPGAACVPRLDAVSGGTSANDRHAPCRPHRRLPRAWCRWTAIRVCRCGGLSAAEGCCAGSRAVELLAAKNLNTHRARCGTRHARRLPPHLANPHPPGANQQSQASGGARRLSAEGEGVEGGASCGWLTLP